VLDSMPKHMQPIVRFALSTGCRAGEIFGLEWNRVDLVRKVAWLDHGATKSGEGRGILLNSVLSPPYNRLLANIHAGVSPLVESAFRKVAALGTARGSAPASKISAFTTSDTLGQAGTCKARLRYRN
jgi:integrase